jgi:hypothetical protein
MERNEWIKLAIKNRLQKCFRCKRWVAFKYQENGDTRDKVCPNCNWSRNFEVVQAEFKNEDGKTYRKDQNGRFREIWVRQHKDGIRFDYI